MRRPGYLIAAAALALIVGAFWYFTLSPGWNERTERGRDQGTANE